MGGGCKAQRILQILWCLRAIHVSAQETIPGAGFRYRFYSILDTGFPNFIHRVLLILDTGLDTHAHMSLGARVTCTMAVWMWVTECGLGALSEPAKQYPSRLDR